MLFDSATSGIFWVGCTMTKPLTLMHLADVHLRRSILSCNTWQAEPRTRARFCVDTTSDRPASHSRGAHAIDVLG